VRHHFVAIKNLDEYYSAAQCESDVMALLPEFWQRGDFAVMCGGSMMYVDAVCRGIDDIPTISDSVRDSVAAKLHAEGLDSLLEELHSLDARYYDIVDRKNVKRVVHAVEICREAGAPYSTLRTGKVKERPFRIVKIGLNMERPLLFERINSRVDKMIELGLEAEARKVYPKRELNSLNTVGYKEMFAWFDGNMDYDTACARIKKNTRVYAKKQLTWYNRDNEIVWCQPEKTLETVKNQLNF
jgi:tRNA dimethylallyltransferase